ncbi:MAG: glycyl-radical enzyme activating protein [Chloroflexota bacterium]
MGTNGMTGRDICYDPTQVGGIVFDIQRYCLNDGPGLRTVVFLKGCALSCQWCANPEARSDTTQIAFFERECFLCGDCVQACPEKAIYDHDSKLEWGIDRCTQCGLCVDLCVSGAFRYLGEIKTAGEVMKQVLRDIVFYGDDGGLTLSGGEPTMQPNFSAALLQIAKQAGIHTAIETCGDSPWENFTPLLSNLDLVLYDLKHIDPEIHERATGADNTLVLDNARRLAEAGIEMIVRVPLIPHFNADEKSLKAITAFTLSLKTVREIHLLPYHTLGKAKYKALGQEYPMEDIPPMEIEEAERLADFIRPSGLSVSVGG